MERRAETRPARHGSAPSDARVTLRLRVRSLLVTNLYPTAERPRLGRFVADQVEALRELGAEVELFTFSVGAGRYLPAVRDLRRLLARERFDVVHAHYGLCGWVASWAGASPLAVTFHGTDVRHPLVGRASRRLLGRIDLAAGVSRSSFHEEAGRPGLGERRGTPSAVLPCGVDLRRFRRIERHKARDRLGLDPDGRYLLFAADPARAVKRHDRAAEVAEAAGAELLVAGEVDPEEMPLLINAAAAVLVSSETEGFGLSCLEALACEVPVLSTPVGIAPMTAGRVQGCLVAPYDRERWSRFAAELLKRPDPRVPGMGVAEVFSAKRMAERVLTAWGELAQDQTRQA